MIVVAVFYFYLSFFNAMSVGTEALNWSRSTKIEAAAHVPAPRPLSPISKYPLSDGMHMPLMGLGVFMSDPGAETYNAVKWALDAGYRLIDTAAYYENEADVGRAIRDSGIPREEIFVTTKLAGDDHGYDKAIEAFENSRRKLDLDYLDLYLIHSPYGGKIVETWDALVELKNRKLVRSIGVSNFNIKHLKAIQDHGRPMPAVNQFEMHPLIYKKRKKLIRWCRKNNILVEAYGSMLFGQKHEEELLCNIAEQCKRSPAQVLLRWGIQHGFQIIPKSVNKQRIVNNLNLFDFELSDTQMELLDNWSGDLDEYWNPLKASVDIGDISHWDPKNQT